MVRSPHAAAARLLVCSAAFSACTVTTPELPPDDVAIVGEGWPEDASTRDASNLGVARDTPAPSDVPIGLDASSSDAPPPPPPPPPDAGCTLPPPVARPPAALPSGEDVVRALAAEHPDWLRDSCVPTGGSYRFLFELVRRGRAVDPRWGLDRRTGPLSGDIVTYFYGDGCPEGRREVYMIDVITRHCAREGIDAPAAPGWIDRTAEMGLWTLMGYGAPPPAAAAAAAAAAACARAPRGRIRGRPRRRRRAARPAAELLRRHGGQQRVPLRSRAEAAAHGPTLGPQLEARPRRRHVPGRRQLLLRPRGRRRWRARPTPTSST